MHGWGRVRPTHERHVSACLVGHAPIGWCGLVAHMCLFASHGCLFSQTSALCNPL
jgi:hypothetical protein